MSYNLNFNQDQNNSETDLNEILPAQEVDANFVANYIAKVYGWMFLALCITAGTALYIAGNQEIFKQIFGNKIVFLGLILGQLFLVGFLSIRIQKMSSITAASVFLLYSLINGFTFSIFLLAYTPAVLATTFGVTAATFGVMSAVGYFTKKDLTSFGRLMFMGLIGIIIASIVNFFLKSPGLYYIISYVGVAVFVGLIAYDTQKIKSYAYLENAEDRKKGAVMGALALYLDFINLFLMLLRIFGRRD
jgi:FtsH-binding integral membrane protein